MSSAVSGVGSVSAAAVEVRWSCLKYWSDWWSSVYVSRAACILDSANSQMTDCRLAARCLLYDVS